MNLAGKALEIGANAVEKMNKNRLLQIVSDVLWKRLYLNNKCSQDDVNDIADEIVKTILEQE